MTTADEKRFWAVYKLPAYYAPGGQALYQRAVDAILEGQYSAPGDPMPFLTEAWPRRRFVELFAAPGVELPPVAVSATHTELARTLWEAVQLDNPDVGRRDQLTALCRMLGGSYLFPVLAESAVTGDGAAWRLLQAATHKMRAINNEVRRYETEAAPYGKARRQMYHATHLAHPAWFGRAVLRPDVYHKYYATVQAWQLLKMPLGSAAATAAATDDTDGTDDAMAVETPV